MYPGLDPTGALIVSVQSRSCSKLTPMPQIGVAILLTWGRTIFREFELLAGKSAPNEFLKLLTYNAMMFSDDIEKVDTVRAYHVCTVIFDICYERMLIGFDRVVLYVGWLHSL